jgi:hypothetical protein
MNKGKNKLERKPSTRKKAQGSMEYMIVLAIVVIVAIVVGMAVLNASSHTKIGNGESIVAAGYNQSTSNTLVLAFSEPLPSGIELSVSGSGDTSASVNQIPSPTYVNGYPEYSFQETGSSPITSGNTVIQASYMQNGQSVTVTTSTGSPIAVQPISGNTVTP